MIIEKIISVETDGVQSGASVEQFACAVMFADISGFTSLTEKLSAVGEEGTEQLTDALNAYFNPLITLVRALRRRGYGNAQDEIGHGN